MKGSNLGEFQELALLTILVLGDEAYGVTIKREINKNVKRAISRGALHTALSRLEEKGYLKSKQGEASTERGGRPKRYYEVTNKGKSALHEAREVRDNLWNKIPSVRLELQYALS
ncbi:PadR family transcriptional regulator [Roseivirga misakiensis]|uniref:PadR family transcriptional regulator n=1 Tax=Roseivirga misakiensis TaxID=1563681 RepID=A0A1E5SKA9_9BACT|nr:PadR family transcriptional regulator [Roseivirga misakiensis]OEJ99543.1 PadR family transcriptional regulator [Roseivirga misakiensis]